MKKISLLISLILFLLTNNGYAKDEVSKCSPKNYLELVRCAENVSSEIKIYDQQLKTGEHLESIADEWINPELDLESVRKGSDKSETSATLFFHVRLGGKKDALVNEARSQKEKIKIERDFSVDRSRLELMLSAYRLSHLKSEIQVTKETVEIYAKIINQYSKRITLSPEQDVSLSVFTMALADQKLKLLKLQSEERKIYQNMQASTSLTFEIVSRNLPSRKEGWPVINEAFQIENAPQVRQALAEFNLAKAQREKARSDAWPDLKIGPAFKAVQENGESSTLVGFGLSIPLPVLNQNNGLRSYSSMKAVESEMILEQTKRKLNASRTELVARYNQIVLNLKNSLSLKIVTEKHKQLEIQFFKGLVPSSLVIEAHRQLQEFEESRNSSEMEALEALGQILITDNQFNEVVL
jgi:outer membrane protein, heavy metal efflux system